MDGSSQQPDANAITDITVEPNIHAQNMHDNAYFSATNLAAYARRITQEPALFYKETIDTFQGSATEWEDEAKDARSRYAQQLSETELDALATQARNHGAGKAEEFIARELGTLSSQQREAYDRAIMRELELAHNQALAEDTKRKSHGWATNFVNSPDNLFLHR